MDQGQAAPLAQPAAVADPLVLLLLFYERPVRKRVVGARNAKYG